MLIRWLLAFLLASTAAAFAQGGPIQQTGGVTPGHVTSWTTDGVVQDAGGPSDPLLTGVGILGSGLPFCIDDAPTSGPYHQLCLGANSLGGGLLSYQAYGGATPETLSFNINGVTYPFTGVVPSITGPSSSVIGTLPVWSNTTGNMVNNGPITEITAVGVGPATAVVGNTPLEGWYAQGGGPLVDMCPGYNFGCPSVGKIRAETAAVATSLGDAGTQEATSNAYMVNKTGQALAWATSTVYTAGVNVVAAGGTNLYVETMTSCTSASTGSGPTGTGSGITDGTCVWNYNGLPGLRGKMAVVGTTLVLPGGTDAWAGDFDTFIEPGWLDQFATGMEIDVTNLSGRDATGAGLTVNDLYLGGSVGTQPITSYISISPFGLMGTNFMAHDGVFIQGQYTIEGHDFRVSTHSLAAFFDDALSVHGTASYIDSSTSPISLLLEGTYSSGNAVVSDNQIQVVSANSGGNVNGFNVTNLGTTVNTTDANFTLDTGNTNSFARIDLYDSSTLSISTGSALTTGITLATAAGPINLNPTTTLKINGTSAVSCAANTVNLTTFTVTAGLVTHC